MVGNNQTLLQSLAGKTCIVTGGTSGIGKETVIGLTRLYADVTIIGRSKEKCEAVTNEIISSTNNKNIRYLLADLSSMNAVRRLAESIVASNSPIDILISDAGGIFSRYELTEDGFESTIALNYLSPFLLTRLLLSNIRKSGSAKIINVKSKAGLNEDEYWIDSIKTICSNFPIFNLSLKGVKSFGKSVVYLGVEPNMINALHRKIVEAISPTPEDSRRYYELDLYEASGRRANKKR